MTQPLAPATLAVVRRALALYAPGDRLTPAQWAERVAQLPQESGAVSGPFRFELTPYLPGILNAYVDPAVAGMACQKGAQVGWTVGVINNVMGWHVDQAPAPLLLVFAKEADADKWMKTKFEPFIRATAQLAAKIPLGAKDGSSTLDYKAFPGGFAKTGSSNSPGNLKSTSARLVLIEEPDDVAKDVRGQGDSVALAKERIKTYPNGKWILGGTPTIKGESQVERAMALSDERRFFVPCPHCGHHQTMRWEQVKWESDALIEHRVYGRHRPDTSRYLCEGETCGALWTEADRKQAILAGEWIATKPFTGVAGFYLSELYSLFPGSRLELLVKKFLEATDAAARGDVELLKSFTNNQLGELWQHQGSGVKAEDLEGRAGDYAAMTVPGDALVATAGVDVQHDRLAVSIWAWAPGEESWCVYWNEIEGSPWLDATWDALDVVLAGRIERHDGAGHIPISAVSVDVGDGQTDEAVYAYVRRCRTLPGRRTLAVKGSSTAGAEIVIHPKDVDKDNTGKAAKFGLQLWMVGTERAKNTIAERLNNGKPGAGAIHWTAAEGVRADFIEQITSEQRIQVRGSKRTKWEKKSGVRNEGLDCAVYALHAARVLRVHTMQEPMWDLIRRRLLNDSPASVAPTPDPPPRQAPPARPGQRPPPPPRYAGRPRFST